MFEKLGWKFVVWFFNQTVMGAQCIFCGKWMPEQIAWKNHPEGICEECYQLVLQGKKPWEEDSAAEWLRDQRPPPASRTLAACEGMMRVLTSGKCAGLQMPDEFWVAYNEMQAAIADATPTREEQE